MYNYQVGEILVATWSEDGTRHAAARVLENSIRLVKARVKAEGEKKATLVEQRTGKLQLLTYPSGEPPREVTLNPAENPDLVKLTGPRGWVYVLAAPNEKERVTCEGVIARAEEARKAEEAKPKRVVPEAFKERRFRSTGGGIAAKILELIQRKGGATVADLRAVSPQSAMSTVGVLRKQGHQITLTARDVSGLRRYVIEKI